MQREFLQYAKESLTQENVPYTLSYEPRKGDGRVLSQGLKLPGITPDLQEKGYYLTLTTDHHGQRTLCQPSYHSNGYGNIPEAGFEWLDAYTNKIIIKEVDIVDFREIRCKKRTYDLFTIEEDVQEGDFIRYICEEEHSEFLAQVSSINRLVYDDQLREEELLIVSIKVQTFDKIK